VTTTLTRPDAVLHYEVRGSGPLVVLTAAPMAADAFAPLAELLAPEFTVLTSDPRGIGRSRLTAPDATSTPELRAADVAALIEHVDAGPAVVLGSSGGAVHALALAQARPDLVRRVVAHEPPLVELLPDRAERHARAAEVRAVFASGDRVRAWRMWLADAGLVLPDEVFDQVFGRELTEQEAADEHFAQVVMEGPTIAFRPDVAALRAVDVVVGIGVDSAGQLCDRTSRALAAALGREPVPFPGDHTGFVEVPDAFAAALRPLLPAPSVAAG
jgi:pimeloyl-ACP methyl ester carboxylesterase